MPPESPCELYILPAAFKEIKSHIEWRVQSADNRYEQGGILIGDVYRDPATRIVYGLVKSVIPSPLSGDETYLKFTQESWIEMHKALDRKKASNPDGGQMRILGWYHTHPNMRVVMSNVDQNTHRKFFSQYWQFSVIFNPQRGIWSVFNGEDCLNCRGKLFCSQADYNKKAYTTGMTALPANVNAGWYSFPGNRAGSGTERVGHGTNRAENRTERVENRTNRAENGTERVGHEEERKTFHITSRTSPPLPSTSLAYSQLSTQSNAAPHRSKRDNQILGPSSAKNGRVLKESTQENADASYPYILSELLYQRTNERMFIIQRELVELLTEKAELQNSITVKNELILLYPLKLIPNVVTCVKRERYFPFENCNGSSIKATGFWYIEDGQYVEHRDWEQPSNRINLAVVYSNQAVDKDKLRAWHEVSAICDCVLWINLQKPGKPDFYALPKFYTTYPFSVRFPRKPECGGLWDYERILSASDFRSRVQGGWIYFDDSIGTETRRFKMSSLFLKRLFEQLRRLQMSPGCCVALTYGAGVDLTDNHAVILRDEPFLNIRVLSFRYGLVDVDAEFFNTTYRDSATDRTPKFVFLFSGGDIDVQQMKSRLFGRDSALLLNIEDAQHFQLCRLFPNG